MFSIIELDDEGFCAVAGVAQATKIHNRANDAIRLVGTLDCLSLGWNESLKDILQIH